MDIKDFSHVKKALIEDERFQLLSTIRYDSELSNTVTAIRPTVAGTATDEKLLRLYLDDIKQQNKLFKNLIGDYKGDLDLELLQIYFKRYFLFLDHYSRIRLSCKYFDWKLKFSELDLLELLISSLPKDSTNTSDSTNKIMLNYLHVRKVYKVRVLYSTNGEIKIEYHELEVPPVIESSRHLYPITSLLSGFLESPELTWNIIRDEIPLKCSPFTSFKTTNRVPYTMARNRMSDIVDKLKLNDSRNEVLLYNDCKYVIEGSITNIAIAGQVCDDSLEYYTPPLTSGCLCGVMRNFLLRIGLLEERSIKSDDIKLNDNILLFNAIMGCVRGKVIY